MVVVGFSCTDVNTVRERERELARLDGRTESVGKALSLDPNPACPKLGRSIKCMFIDENVV